MANQKVKIVKENTAHSLKIGDGELLAHLSKGRWSMIVGTDKEDGTIIAQYLTEDEFKIVE